MKIEIRKQIRRAFRERNKMGDVVDFTAKKQVKMKEKVYEADQIRLVPLDEEMAMTEDKPVWHGIVLFKMNDKEVFSAEQLKDEDKIHMGCRLVAAYQDPGYAAMACEMFARATGVDFEPEQNWVIEESIFDDMLKASRKSFYVVEIEGEEDDKN